MLTEIRPDESMSTEILSERPVPSMLSWPPERDAERRRRGSRGCTNELGLFMLVSESPKSRARRCEAPVPHMQEDNWRLRSLGRVDPLNRTVDNGNLC